MYRDAEFRGDPQDLANLLCALGPKHSQRPARAHAGGPPIRIEHWVGYLDVRIAQRRGPCAQRAVEWARFRKRRVA